MRTYNGFMGFGLVQERLRRRKGISQERLAELADLSSGTISDIETKDRTPTMTTVKKIAEALEVTPDYMLKEAGELKAEKLENEIIAEALHVDPEVWKSLSDEEKEFILRDAREKAEFFTKSKGH